MEADATRARFAAAEAKSAPPGAGARWVKATEYLQSAVEKTAEGYSEEEGLAPDAPPPPVPPEPEVVAPRPKPRPKAEPWSPSSSSSSASSSSSSTSPPPFRADAAGRERPATAAANGGGDPPRPSLSQPPPVAKAKAKEMKESPLIGLLKSTGKSKGKGKKRGGSGGGGGIFDPEIVDEMDDLTDIPGLTPEKEAAIAAEIRRLEQMYGDGKNVSPEEYDRMCEDIIDKYGLADKKFTENEMWDPREDPSLEKRHPSEDDPFYWRKLKMLHPIFDAAPDTKTTTIMTMMMTHPGLPAYLPGGKKPGDKNHAIAFESREDAERFCWFMRATRVDGEGICTTQPMPPATMERFAEESGLGVTVVGGGRVDLAASRRDMDVLQDIREIGGEQYIWEFAQFTKNQLEERRKPPPPTISY